jgi:hypothetical protein
VAQTGLQAFEAVLKQYYRFARLAFPGSLPPLLNLLFRLGPPPAASISVLTVAINFITIMVSFHYLRNLSPKSASRLMLALLGVFCAGVAVTGTLQLRFTSQPVAGQDRIVMGSELKGDVKRLITATYTTSKALEDAEYDPERVWTSESIARVYTALFVSWITVWVSITMFMTLFILRHRGFGPRPGRGPRLRT